MNKRWEPLSPLQKLRQDHELSCPVFPPGVYFNQIFFKKKKTAIKKNIYINIQLIGCQRTRLITPVTHPTKLLRTMYCLIYMTSLWLQRHCIQQELLLMTDSSVEISREPEPDLLLKLLHLFFFLLLWPHLSQQKRKASEVLCDLQCS